MAFAHQRAMLIYHQLRDIPLVELQAHLSKELGCSMAPRADRDALASIKRIVDVLLNAQTELPKLPKSDSPKPETNGAQDYLRQWAETNDATPDTASPDPLEVNKTKYKREIVPGVMVDVYEVLRAFGTGCPAIDHAVKKLLAPGKRGGKDALQDKREAIQSIVRSIEIDEQFSEHGRNRAR